MDLRRTIEEITEVLEKVDKYRWHDLTENPDDLPRQYGSTIFSVDVLIATEVNKDFSTIAYIDLGEKVWYPSSNDISCDNVIAWKYIEPFEKSVSTEESEE